MWIRSAFWIGSPKAGHEEEFQQRMDHVMVPGMRALPGVRDAKALWPRKREDNPPNIACQFMVEFDTHADVERMLACPERAAIRPKVLEMIALFDGQFSHIEYEVNTH